jgi:hypothetical protein
MIRPRRWRLNPISGRQAADFPDFDWGRRLGIEREKKGESGKGTESSGNARLVYFLLSPLNSLIFCGFRRKKSG